MNNNGNFTLGLDLAQASFTAAIAPQGVDPKTWRALPNTAIAYPPDSTEARAALLEWMKRTCPDQSCVLVVVESTGALSRRVAYGLNEVGLETAIINPCRSKALGVSLGVRDKTDAVDCVVLALYGALYRPAPTRLRSAAHERICAMVRLRETLVQTRTAWLNRFSQSDCREVGRVTKKTVLYFERQIEELNEAIDDLIEQDEQLSVQVKTLDQIEGIGEVTAKTLTAELGDLRLYSRGQIVALAGVFPKRFESGQSVHRPPRMAKGGGGRLRRVLYMCASSLFHSRGVWRDWIERRRAEGFSDMCIIGIVMRKLLLVCRAVMVAGGRYDPKKIGQGVLANC